MKKYINQNSIDVLLLIIFSVILFFSETILRFPIFNKYSIQAFEFALVPSALFLFKSQNVKKYLWFGLSLIILGVFNFSVLQDPYLLVHPFFTYHLKVVMGFAFFSILINGNEHNESHILRSILSAAIFIFLFFIYQFMFQQGDFNYWDRLNTIVFLFVLGTNYQILNVEDFFSLPKLKDRKIKYYIQLAAIIFFGIWSIYSFKQQGSYHKFNFFFMSLIVASCLPRYFKLFMMILMGILTIQTARQVPLINFDVTYSFLFVSGLASILLLISQFIKQRFQLWICSGSVFILMMTFFKPIHLYQKEQIALIQSLKSLSTRIGIYQKAKIVPATKPVSEEAKKVFGRIFTQLVRYHPLSSYESLFKINIKQVFSHARPMYSDETYDKHISRMRSVMNQLNLDWQFHNVNQSRHKQFVLSSIDFNDRITKINDDDYVSNDLNLTLPLKSGKVVRSKLDTKGAMIFLFINDRPVLNYSLNEIIFNQVPGKFDGNMFKADIQPDILEKEIESEGVRLRVKINRIVGRKQKTSFTILQVNGQLFIKEL